MAAEYLSIQLSMRDREEIMRVLCKSNPDLLTQLVRELVDAYEPVIRRLHNAVDLAASITDTENFMNDLVKLLKSSKPGKKEEKESQSPPTVEDYHDLLNKHAPSSHRFLHQICKNGEELTGWYKEYMKEIVKEFQQAEISRSSTPEINGHGAEDVSVSKPSITAAGDMTQPLNDLIAELPPNDQKTILDVLEKYADYLSKLYAFSNERMKTTLAMNTATTLGPGAYLQRWRDLMNKTLITPMTAQGPLRTGNSESVKDEAMVDVDGNKLGERFEIKEERELPEVPDVTEVIRLCAPGFKKLLQTKSIVIAEDDVD